MQPCPSKQRGVAMGAKYAIDSNSTHASVEGAQQEPVGHCLCAERGHEDMISPGVRCLRGQGRAYICTAMGVVLADEVATGNNILICCR